MLTLCDILILIDYPVKSRNKSLLTIQSVYVYDPKINSYLLAGQKTVYCSLTTYL